MKKIGIIGGGFSGTMTCVQIIEKALEPLEVILINESETLNKGTAYNPYSDKHLLNVIAGKMSAFPDLPDHFLEWVMSLDNNKAKDRTLISNSYLPRKLYGEYLKTIWQEARKKAELKQIKLSVIDSRVEDLKIANEAINLKLENGDEVNLDSCVIATGNQIPRNPRIINTPFFDSPNYFQNPWKMESVLDTKENMPILIIGNGLTMVDTFLGLLEQGFKGEIYSISPNGFNILPHRHNGLKYTKLVEEMKDRMSLLDLVSLMNRHIKTIRMYGVSAEPVIDSLRPYTQGLWRAFTESEKKIFMSRLRHLWGVARHRIPLHTHDKIQKSRIDGRLRIKSGKLIDIIETSQGVQVKYFDKKENRDRELIVSRVINCTGPETNLMNLENCFLKKCLMSGIIVQDSFKLGIRADINTFQLMNAEGKLHTNLFAIGSHLKGELWESTAVSELREQASGLAKILIQVSQEAARVDL